MKIKIFDNYFGHKNVNLINKIKDNLHLIKFNFIKEDFFEKFKPLVYEKSNSVIEAKNYACQHFQISDICGGQLKEINNVNSSLCNIYNLNKGKVLFPPFIKVYKHRGQHYSGEYGANVIYLNTSYDIFPTLAHEIAHYNHEKTSSNYIKMGKKSEIIDAGSNDFSILNKFMDNKNALKTIKKELCGYACSSPAEFVACTFEAIMCRKQLSPEILKIYKEYEGPNAEILKLYFK